MSGRRGADGRSGRQGFRAAGSWCGYSLRGLGNAGCRVPAVLLVPVVTCVYPGASLVGRGARSRAFASAGRWRTVVDSLATNVAVLDERGVILAVNEGWSEFAAVTAGIPGCLGLVRAISRLARARCSLSRWLPSVWARCARWRPASATSSGRVSLRLTNSGAVVRDACDAVSPRRTRADRGDARRYH